MFTYFVVHNIALYEFFNTTNLKFVCISGFHSGYSATNI